MSIVLTIVAVIVIFSVLVLIHEYGHFLAARRSGIKVLEFGIGFPPRLFGKKIGETLYSVNAIPFGGFVKLFGEDATSPEIINHKRSFAHKSPWVRTKVVCAGVFMNFILAIALLTTGFIFGIEPLLVTEQDLFAHLAAGTITSEPGVFVKEVSHRDAAPGLSEGDKILSIDDVPVTESRQLEIFAKGKAVKDIDLVVAKKSGGPVERIHLPILSASSDFGVRLKPYTDFQSLVIAEVKPFSKSFEAGLAPGDHIIKVNGYLAHQMMEAGARESVIASGANTVNYLILRNGMLFEVPVRIADTRTVAIADVFKDSVAEKSGFQKGDLIVTIDGAEIRTPEQVQDILKSHPQKEMSYELSRNGAALRLNAVTGEKNVLGIALSSVTSFLNSELSLYYGNVLTSITEIKKVHYTPWNAFKQAIFESARLTTLTAKAFIVTLTSLVSKFTVPEEIGGPVQIAYYTHTFIREGFFALLRFTALLSLSLAVINVLPIPALDGGRLLFIVIEVIFKKRVSARIETAVHSIGFVLLLLLIGMVTYSDIVKLF